MGRRLFKCCKRLNSKSGDKESYQVNASAVLSYGGGSKMSFPSSVCQRITVHDLQFEKWTKRIILRAQRSDV